MNRFREVRLEKGYTQMQVAEALGITQRQLSSWETGKYEPDLASLKKLADFYNTPVDYLIGRTELPF